MPIIRWKAFPSYSISIDRNIQGQNNNAYMSKHFYKCTNNYITVCNALYFRRCVVDSTTHIISQERRETKFEFESFEFPTNSRQVYVTCNTTLCTNNDNTDACRQACHNRRSADYLTSGFITETSSVTLNVMAHTATYTGFKGKLRLDVWGFNFHWDIYIFDWKHSVSMVLK